MDRRLTILPRGPSPVSPAEAPADTAAERRLKREEKLQWESARPLLGWERYRVLRDTLETGVDLVDLADRKARFGLMLLGMLNAVLFVGGRQAMDSVALPGALVALALAVYAALEVFCILTAIEALRPRGNEPAAAAAADPADAEVRVDVIVGHLGERVRAVAAINEAKFAAVRRLYHGLKAMTVLTVGLLVVAGAFVLA